MSGQCVRFVRQSDETVVVETLSTVSDPAGGEVLATVSSMGEAYDLASSLDLNVRYVLSTDWVRPLVVLR